MTSFLVDENLSPKLAAYLRRHSLKARAVREVQSLKGKDDQTILNFALREKMAVITGDQEFGRFFYERLGETSIAGATKLLVQALCVR